MVLLIDEIKRRQMFWNSLVEIERDIRKRALALGTEHSSQEEIDRLKAEVAELRNEVKKR